MAKFSTDFSAGNDAMLSGEAGKDFSVDELLEVLRPAAIRLRDAYVKTLDQIFSRRSGQLAESIMLDDDYIAGSGAGGKTYAFITIAPYGRRKKSRRKSRSRAGSAGAKYAKHNRRASSTSMTNAELGWLLEHGTPRIPATHWMENTNDALAAEIQESINTEFQALLDKKGL